MTVSPEYLFFGAVVAGLVAATILVDPGQALTEPTTLDGDGVACVEVDGELVPADPAALAKGMGVSPDALALARAMVSEAGSLPWIAQIGVAWTIVNHARDAGRSVLAVVTRATLHHGKDDGSGDGYFGGQGDPTGGYRYVASSRNSTDDSRSTAVAVLAGEIDDPTGGAVNFDSPDSYGVQAGTVRAGAEAFEAAREQEGKEIVILPGVSESRIRFWRRA